MPPQHTDITPSSTQPTPPVISKKNFPRKWVIGGSFVIGIIVMYMYYHHLATPPPKFPQGSTFSIAEGSSVAAVTQELEKKNLVRSSELLYVVFLTNYSASSLKAGTYNITGPLNVHEIAELIASGDFTADLQRITHREGESVKKLAARLDEVLVNFDNAAFIAEATPFEGTLYPDTYLVPATITNAELITLMRNRYSDVIKDIERKILDHPLAEAEIINLASIIEREANSTDSMRLVSGILQNRLEIDMPLQVDASMEYILDKPLAELEPSDLQQESPYNTYLNQGLPPTPIGNPGLESIMAVLEPTTSDYFYYITGRDGTFHYARTFDAHRQNIQRYLR